MWQNNILSKRMNFSARFDYTNRVEGLDRQGIPAWSGTIRSGTQRPGYPWHFNETDFVAYAPFSELYWNDPQSGLLRGIEVSAHQAIYPLAVISSTSDNRWKVNSRDAWITIEDAADGRGSGSIKINVAANDSFSERLGFLDISTDTPVQLGFIRVTRGFVVYQAPEPVASPVFTPNGGAYLTDDIDVTLDCSTPDAAIHYTLDGSIPTMASTVVTAGNQVVVPVPSTLKARAFREGLEPSAIALANFARQTVVTPPLFDLDTGAYTGDSLAVVLSCATPDVTIHYTLDGSEPTETSVSTLSGETIIVPLPSTLKARAFRDDMEPSSVKRADYLLDAVAMPDFAPGSGPFTGDQLEVVISCPTPDATIRYTLDSSEPDETSSTIFSGENLIVPIPSVLTARAYRQGMAPSPARQAAYLAAPSVATPAFSPEGGSRLEDTVSVLVTCATLAATIRYTTDGRVPTESDPIIVSGAMVTLPVPGALHARAFKAGMNPSTIGAVDYFRAHFFVAPNGDNGNDGRSWDTAKRTIQAAVDAADGGETIWVADGIYATGGRVAAGQSLTNRVALTKPVHLRSVNGPDTTFIVGAPDTAESDGRGPAAIRCLYMAEGASVSGFTLTNGWTAAGSGADSQGGGVWGAGLSAVVSNCVISGNAAMYGGGGYGVSLFDTIISGNQADQGGGVFAGAAYRCTIEGNTALDGGGTSKGVYHHCVIRNNHAENDGGGSHTSTYRHCIISGNVAGRYGGGAYDGEYFNCLIVGNEAQEGGGVRGGTLWNCTIVGNLGGWGGGASRSTLRNCIVYYNSWHGEGTTSNLDNYYRGTLSHSFTPDNSGEPLFMVLGAGFGTNHVAGDYRLQDVSTCINAGQNQEWMADDSDLDGNPRVFAGVVDIGAYEYQGTGIVSMVSLDPDGDFFAGSSVMVTLDSLTPGATIHYTIDNSPPTASSPATSPGDIIEVPVPGTLKAQAFKDGMLPSDVRIAVYLSLPEDSGGMAHVRGGPAFPMNTRPDFLEKRHTIVSSFFLAPHETTWEEWRTVRDWAIGSGYDFGDTAAGSGDNHPVHSVNWHDAVKWCNARSEMEGLVPVYYTDEEHTDVYRSGTVDLVNANVLWEANGHRLPTEAEWRYAARGGAHSEWNAMAYSGSETLDEVGWYEENSAGAPVAMDDAGRGTWPVGGKQPNQLGLYDMSGNVYEWVWDRPGEITTTPVTDPHGGDEGADRMAYGGAWNSNDSACGVLSSLTLDPHYWEWLPPGWRESIGFRTIRSTVLTSAAVLSPNDWLAFEGLFGDPLDLFRQICPVRGMAHGFRYAFGTNLPPARPLLNIRIVNGRPVVETPARDGATAPYVGVRVVGTDDLTAADWILPLRPAPDTTGKPADADWTEPDGDTPGKAFFRLEAELK